jgi:ADP-heptose:LPS heptosyltransferase
MSLPSTGHIRVGLNFDSMGRVKSYPSDLQHSLISRLLSLNLELHLFGRKIVSSGLAESNYGTHNHVNQTNIPELAALLDQMDLVLGVDSFVAHLSSLLGKRTLVLLSTTGEDYFHHYPAVSPYSSRLPCAPCFHVSNTCSLGHARCAAFYHESMDTDLLVSRVVMELSGMYGSNHG